MAQKHNFLLRLLVTPPKNNPYFFADQNFLQTGFCLEWSQIVSQSHLHNRPIERETENKLNESSIGLPFPHTNIYIVSSLKAITYPKPKPTKQLVRGGRGPILKKLIVHSCWLHSLVRKWPNFCIWHGIKVRLHTYLPENHDLVKDLLTFKPRWKYKTVYKLVQVKY